MIYRTRLRCEGCSNEFLLRLELLPSKLTRLAIPCPHCSYPIRGRYQGLELDEVKLEWIDAVSNQEPAGDIRDGEIVLTAGTSVPLRPDARLLTDFGGGPNITFGRLIGQNRRANAIHQRMMAMGSTWRQYERMLHYYLANQWNHFDSAGKRLFPDWITPPSPQAQHIAALQPAILLLLPLIPGSLEADLFTPALDGVKDVASCGSYIAWAQAAEQMGSATKAQKSLFERLKDYIGIWECWSPGLVVRYTDSTRKHELGSLRVYRDEFEVLRDAYVQVYETCCQALPFAMAMMNAQARGNPDSFGPVPSPILQANARAVAPASLSAFARIPNAHKVLWCRDWAGWENSLPTLLDNKLRNAIGHASAHYDVTNGTIEAAQFSLSYLEFTARVMDLFHPLLALLQILKSTRLMAADGVAPAS